MGTGFQHLPNRSELAAAYQLSARLWLHEVDADILALLLEPAVANAWQSLGGNVPAQSAATPETLDRLAEDYCQLLIGPKGHLPPVQSVWSDQVFQSESAASTHRFYELFPDYQPPASIDDHLGCQLNFVSFLLNNPASFSEAAEVLDRFCTEHLQWPVRLLDRVAEKAKTDFYRGLAEVTQKLVADIA